METDHYRLLGIEPDADGETIRQAFLRLAKETHPDVAGGDGDAMRALNRAYAILSEPAARAAYDRSLPPSPVPDESGIHDLLKGAVFLASSAAAAFPAEQVGGSGWLSLAEGTPWIEARLAQPGWLCEFRLEAVPHPYPVKRRHRNAVEIHCLYGEHAGRIRMLHEFRLATPGDRDLALRFPEPPGPFSILRLATVKAPPVAIGWRNLRVYGRLAAK